jgi:hypothetical protein
MYLNRKERFLIGNSPSQSLYLISDNKYGIVVGIGLYKKLLTAKVYPFDSGIIASVGVKILSKSYAKNFLWHASATYFYPPFNKQKTAKGRVI